MAPPGRRTIGPPRRRTIGEVGRHPAGRTGAPSAAAVACATLATRASRRACSGPPPSAPNRRRWGHAGGCRWSRWSSTAALVRGPAARVGLRLGSNAAGSRRPAEAAAREGPRRGMPRRSCPSARRPTLQALARRTQRHARRREERDKIRGHAFACSWVGLCVCPLDNPPPRLSLTQQKNTGPART